ncbi:MAG: NAD(P)H-dependent oxidoreductase [Halofilum sp. (in: g-proteobacteria)]|nr:NAD(P)H-dependent oxidoreductase [Halofilum sp. (in: g-proteobacteria)]
MPEEPRRRLLVVAHDPSPNTARMVEAVLHGARHEEIEAVETRHVRPLEAGPADVLEADALILGTTENLGYMSGALKDFFDRTYYRVIEQTEGMPYALYVRAGMDGTGTRRAVESICTGLSWKAVQEPLICRGEWQDAFLEQCEELGLYMAASLDSQII